MVVADDPVKTSVCVFQIKRRLTKRSMQQTRDRCPEGGPDKLGILPSTWTIDKRRHRTYMHGHCQKRETSHVMLNLIANFAIAVK